MCQIVRTEMFTVLQNGAQKQQRREDLKWHHHVHMKTRKTKNSRTIDNSLHLSPVRRIPVIACVLDQGDISLTDLLILPAWIMVHKKERHGCRNRGCKKEKIEGSTHCRTHTNAASVVNGKKKSNPATETRHRCGAHDYQRDTYNSLPARQLSFAILKRAFGMHRHLLRRQDVELSLVQPAMKMNPKPCHHVCTSWLKQF